MAFRELPSFDTFLENLDPCDIAAYTADRCSICHHGYTNSFKPSDLEFLNYDSAALERLDFDSAALEMLKDLYELPFPYPAPHAPVILHPNHALGFACSYRWLKIGSTCPFDRLALCLPNPVHFRHGQSASDYEIAASIRSLPLRPLLIDEWNTTQRIKIKSIMKATLTTFMFRIAFRLAKVQDSEVLTVWLGDKSSHMGEQCSTRSMGYWPSPSIVTGQPDEQFFEEVVQIFDVGVRLFKNGKFDQALRMLHKQDVATMYAVLCSEITAMCLGKKVSETDMGEMNPEELYHSLFKAVTDIWRSKELPSIWAGRELFLRLVLKAWISEERRVGKNSIAA